MNDLPTLEILQFSGNDQQLAALKLPLKELVTPEPDQSDFLLTAASLHHESAAPPMGHKTRFYFYK